MNTLNIKHIPNLESLSDEALHEALASAGMQSVGCVNWPDEFPYRPEVHFRMAYSDKSIAVLFEVTEEHVKAAALEDNGPVWEDSCVEFFIMTADGEHYVNFEMNCIGTLLAARRTGRNDAEHFDAERLAHVRHFTSLPHVAADIRGERLNWWAVEVIPFELLGFSGKPDSLRANLYKCGDRCDNVHFLSWSPIGLPTPDFHCPDYFGEIVLA